MSHRYHTPQPPRSKQLNQSEWSTPQPNYKGHQGSSNSHHQGHQGPSSSSSGFGNGGTGDYRNQQWANNYSQQQQRQQHQQQQQQQQKQQGWPGEYNYNRSYQRGSNLVSYTEIHLNIQVDIETIGGDSLMTNKGPNSMTNNDSSLPLTFIFCNFTVTIECCLFLIMSHKL